MVVEPKSLEVYLKKIFSQCCWTMVRLCRMTAKQKYVAPLCSTVGIAVVTSRGGII